MNTRALINSLLTLLLVEDNLGDATLLQRTLPKDKTSITHVDRLQQAIRLLREKRFDVILLDLSLPDSVGLETLNQLYPATADTPIVVLTGSDDDALAVQAVQHGAQDYIVKGQMSGDIIMRLLRYAIERKRAELELKASEKRFRALIENSADLILVIDAEGVIHFVSPSAERILGYSPAEAMGRNFLEWVHPDDIAIALEALASRREISGTAQARVELRGRHKDGSWRAVEILGTNLLAEPAVNGIVLNVRDVTERKRAEDEIRKRNEDLSLINAINAAVNRGDSLEEIIALISSQTKTLFNSNGASLHLLDAERKRLVMQNMGIPKKQVAQIEEWLGFAIPPISFALEDPHPFRKVLETGQAYLESDPEKMRAFVAAYIYGLPLTARTRARLETLIPAITKLLNIKSLLVVPLVSNGEIIGTLDIGSHRYFGAEDLKRLEYIAGQLTVAIQRAQAELAQQRSEARYRDLVENIHELICTHDLEGNLLSINRAVADMLGYAHEEIIGRNLRDFLAPEVRHHFKDYLSLVQKRGTAIGVMKVQTKNGETRVWEYHNTLRTEGVEKPIVRGYAHDVTEKRRAEQALRESEKRFRSLVENSSDEISILNAKGELLYESPSAHPTLGYLSGEFLGQNLFQLIHPDDLERVQKQFARLAEDPQLHPRDQFRLRHRDGEWRWVEAVGSNLLADPSVRGVVINYHDITERKRAEGKLKAQFDELQRWYNATVDREERVLQLKREINELLHKLNEPIRYPSAE